MLLSQDDRINHPLKSVIKNKKVEGHAVSCALLMKLTIHLFRILQK